MVLKSESGSKGATKPAWWLGMINAVAVAMIVPSTLYALAKGYNGLDGTLWMLALAATAAMTAIYDHVRVSRWLYGTTLGMNGAWTALCLWGSYTFPSLFILAAMGLLPASNFILLFSRLPRTPQPTGIAQQVN